MASNPLNFYVGMKHIRVVDKKHIEESTDKSIAKRVEKCHRA